MSASPPPFVLGRFPPPLDGQTIATERLATLLAEAGPVRRLDVSARERDMALGVRLRPRRIAHYAGLTRRLRQALAADPLSPVLWTAVSPSPLSHARDWLTTVPAFRPRQRVFAVVHHGDFDRLFTRRVTAWSGGQLVRRLAGIVFLTEALAHACSPWVPDEKRFVIPNTIFAGREASSAEITEKRRARADRDVLRVLFVSNMIPSKGFDDVLVALHRLRQRGRTVEARFIGRWPSQEAEATFATRVRALELSGVVEHLGTVRNDDAIRGWYLWADAFALPTYYPTEAQPLVLLEALSAGTPVVTTRQGGIPDMVRDGEEGALVPARDPEALACALDTLYADDRWQRQSEAARARYLAAFSAEAVRQRWLALLAGVPATPEPFYP